jgi:single-stranded-DNA-specific exonuclease
VGAVALEIPQCRREHVRALTVALGVSEPLAQVLVRRGLHEPDAAEAFLTASESHQPDRFAGLEAVLAPILQHVRERRRITVHGDYDVDGVCATAILVGALRRLGADVGWRLPRRADGYGLQEQTVRELSARGTSLLLTVDCGITSVQEVALARSLGIEVVITDHHSPRADGALPDAPIMHPRLCGYPCPELCATAVAHKLTLALWDALGRDPGELEPDLELVALATVADVVALRGENRRLLQRGLLALRRTVRPGLQALIAVAGLDPVAVDERAVGFALAPRINAAGRLHSPAAALELLMTDDQQRARRLAAELDRCNRDRRATEHGILLEAEAQVRELGPQAGYVLAGEGWHVGVVGIVAARIAERHNRPAMLVALDGERGRGSGRSIAKFDLLAGLSACERHLLRFGGHSAAAGVEVERGRLDAFRAAFAAYAEARLQGQDLLVSERVDAVVGGRDLGMELAQELRRLAPFGRGNPAVCLLVRDARFEQVRAMGEGRHARFLLRSEGVCAGGVAFGGGGTLPVGEGELVQATFKLEVNEWRGSSEPRLVLRHVISDQVDRRRAPEQWSAPARRPAARKAQDSVDRQESCPLGEKAFRARAEPSAAQPLQLELALP